MSKAWKTCKLIVRKKTFREQGKFGKTKENLAKKFKKTCENQENLEKNLGQTNETWENQENFGKL